MTFKIYIKTALILLLAMATFFDADAQKRKKKELSETDKISFTNHFMEGQKQKMIENPEEALISFKRALKIIPDNDAAKYEIARIYFEQNRVSESQSLIGEALKKDEKNEWYNALLAQTYISQNKLESALKIYEQILADHPDKKDYLFEIANINLFLGNNKQALEVFDRIEESFGLNEEIVREKINLYDQMGKTKEAIELLEELSAKNPNNPFYTGMLAEYYRKSGDGQKGKEKFEEILAEDPGNGMAHLSLHDIYIKEGNEEQAMYHLKKAIESDDLNIDIKMNILLTYYSIAELDSPLFPYALSLSKILAEKHPNEAKSHAIKGDFLLRDSKLEEARTSFLRAIELAPDKSIIWSQILAIDFELGEFENMVKHSNDCLELFPTNPEYYYFNGLALNQTEEYDEAVLVLNSGKSLVFDNDVLKADFYSLLGDSYNSLKDHKNSDSSFESALKLNPNNPLVLNNYSYYLSLRGEKLERAEEMIVNALRIVPDNPSYLDTYAWVLFKSNKLDEARIQIEKAIEKGGFGSGAVLEHYGDILYLLGEQELALEKWEEAKILGDTSESLEKKIKDKKYYE